MIRSLPWMWLLSIGGVLVLVAQGTAQERKPSKTSLPKGLRVMFSGNSWFNFVPGGVADQVKAVPHASLQHSRRSKKAKIKRGIRS